MQCDENRPSCSYCALRILECVYLTDMRNEQSVPSSEHCPSSNDELNSLNGTLDSPLRYTPSLITSSGQLGATELRYLHHYKTNVWSVMSLQENDQVAFINRDWVPQTSISTSHMLYSILSISAMHLHSRSQSTTPGEEALALTYRQKAFTSYNIALRNITSENYESLLITSMWMMVLVHPPALPCTDNVCLAWASSLFTMMQGLRILASLKWASGIEKLTIYPLFRRELKKLPPPPMLTPLPDWFFYTSGRPQGDEWRRPNAPEDTYTEGVPECTGPNVQPLGSLVASLQPQSAGVLVDDTKIGCHPQRLMFASNSPHAPLSWKANKPSWALPAPAFLPPPLLVLLQRLVDNTQTGPLDFHRPVLIPVLHALSPIFLSLYYYRLSPDVHVRIFVLPTFLTAEFLALVRNQEPRALVLLGWWFALLTLLPQTNKWFTSASIARLLQSVSNVIMRNCDRVLMDAMEGAYRIIAEEQRGGREAAARTIFEKWEGVIWEEGPEREEQWRLEGQWRSQEHDG